MERLVIIGAGESGVGAAILGKTKGFEVFVSDKSLIKEQYKKDFSDLTNKFLKLQKDTETFYGCSVLQTI